MPNWVYNTVTLEGKLPLVRRVRDKLASPVAESGEVNPFSFWNIVHPKDSEMEDYRATIGWSKEHSDWKDHNDPTNWYQWNIRNWGCKWDSCNTEVTSPLAVHKDKATDEMIATVTYSFETPWSPPTEALTALSKKYPRLTIRHYFEEEQGWGGEGYFQGGLLYVEREWDIPAYEEEEVSI